MIIDITYDERVKLYRAAKKKEQLSQVCYSFENPNFVGKKQNEKLRNYIGFLGEFAMARYLDIPYEPRVKNSSDQGYDLLWNDIKIEVKTRCHRNPNMFVKLKDKLIADVYVLVKIDDKSGDVTIVGWTDNNTVREAPVSDPGNYGAPCRVIKSKQLNPITVLSTTESTLGYEPKDACSIHAGQTL